MAWGLGGGKLSGELVYRVSMKDTAKFEADSVKVRESMTGMGKTGAATGSGLMSLGSAAVAAGGLIVASKFYQWLKSGADDFRAMRKEVRLLGQDLRALGDSTADVDALAKRAEDLRLKYGVGDEKEVLSAMRGMVGPAFTGAEAGTQVEPMLQAYKAGYGELNQLIPFTTEAIRVFNLQAEDTTRILEVGRVAAARSYVEFDEFNTLFARNSATLKVANLSYEEMMATIATMSASGAEGRSLIGDLGRVLGALRQPTAEARRELKGAGVDINQDLVPMLEDLGGALESGKLDLSKIAPDERSQSAILTLISYLPTLKSNLDAVSSSGGMLKKDVGEAMDTVGFKMSVLTAISNELKESAGSGLVDAFGQLFALFGSGYDQANSLNTVLAVMGAILHDIVYVLVGGGTINAIRQATKEIGTFAHTADLLSQGKLKEAWAAQVEGLKEVWGTAGEGFKIDDIVRGEGGGPAGGGGGGTSSLTGSLAASAARLEELRKQYNDAMNKAAGTGGGGGGKKAGPAEGSEAWYLQQQKDVAEAGREAQFQADMAAAVQMGFEKSLAGLQKYRELQAGPAFGMEALGPGSSVVDPEAFERTQKMLEDEDKKRREAWEDWWKDQNAELTGVLTDAVMSSFEQGGLASFLESQAKKGLSAGVEKGITQGLKATGVNSFLNIVIGALNAIPVVGPILSAMLSGFLGGFGMEYGGILRPRPGGYPIRAAEAGKPEGYMPLTGEALYEVARGIDLIRAGGPGERAALPAAGGGSGKHTTIISVSGRDILGLDIKEVESQGAAAMALKVG